MSPSKLEFTRDMSVLFNQKYCKEAKKNDKGWLSYIYGVPQRNGTIKIRRFKSTGFTSWNCEITIA